MKKLLSLPPNLVSSFHEIEEVSHDEYYCTSDPVGSKLGSGGGTHWLLKNCWQETSPHIPFADWLASEKRILLHAGGQSRRLPSYAPSGKILTPIPIFRWARGQRLSQNLLHLQLPLYERIMRQAPDSLHTLIASGDVLVRARNLQEIPQADVVCYGLWADPTIAQNHGVFLSRRETPHRLDFMLQKPTLATLARHHHTHHLLMDVGIWLLSDRAVELLLARSSKDGEIVEYDLYSDFGQSLGENPTCPAPHLAPLTVAILPLQEGEFYHYGTSPELISSTLAIQNHVYEQRAIIHLDTKPHPSIFIQNAHTQLSLTDANQNIWIENSWIGPHWELHRNHIITGVPQNDWHINLPEGACVDLVPIDEHAYALRTYNYHDTFAGQAQHQSRYPISEDLDELGSLLPWMLGLCTDNALRQLWERLPKMSASTLSDRANLLRLHRQRLARRKENLPALASNHRHSIFYQANLDAMARDYHRFGLPLPEQLPESEPLLTQVSDQMFRRQVVTLSGRDGTPYEKKAHALLRDALTQHALQHPQHPRLDVCADQIVWGRSPVRIDIAGGWTDTPPYSLTHGGSVVNLAVQLNGQPPLHAYIKPSPQPHITLHSIDYGVTEHITTYDQLQDFTHVGSPFSIPKAALCLAGFHPRYSAVRYPSLCAQLQDFGSGIEITLLSAIPAGSGLGTSSILAANLLSTISNFCALAWDTTEVCNRTLILEQMLTTGGGWQDQYGGILNGVKHLQTMPGLHQSPQVRWLPDTLFTHPDFAPCHLLYYTGITRTAKDILTDIVRRMHLFDTETLALLDEMHQHAADTYDAIQQGDFNRMGRLVAKTWLQNQSLDSGTNPPTVRALVQQVSDLCLGLKLPGAGGGGFLYMVAKDPEAAQRIRSLLTQTPPNPRARFVEMTLSRTGQQTSRS